MRNPKGEARYENDLTNIKTNLFFKSAKNYPVEARRVYSEFQSLLKLLGHDWMGKDLWVFLSGSMNQAPRDTRSSPGSPS